MPAPNFRTLDLNLLRVFDQVMAERSLTKAALNLALTQPAVSNALSRLRHSLGDELVQRRGQSMQPTALALTLWPHVRTALAQLQSALAPGEFVAKDARNTFLLTMADATAAELLPTLMAVLAEQAPQVSVRVVPLTTRDPRAMLSEQLADLAVGHFPVVMAAIAAQEHSGESVTFAHQRLFHGDYVCVMRRSHALAGQPLTLQSYCAERHLRVSFSGRPVSFVDHALATLGQRRRVVLTVNQFFTAARVVTQSNLLAVLPRHFVSVTGVNAELVAFDLPFAVAPIHVDALWHQRQSQVPAQQWLRGLVAELAHAAFGGSADTSASALLAKTSEGPIA